MIKRRPQPSVIVIFKRDKSKRLQHAGVRLAHGAEHFGHAAHRPRLGLKRDFDKIALAQRTRNLKQSAGDGNGLEFSFSVPAIFETNRSQDRLA